MALEAGFTLHSDDRILGTDGPFFVTRSEVIKSGPLFAVRTGLNVNLLRNASVTLGVRYVRTKLKTIETAFNAYGAAGGSVSTSTVDQLQLLFGINFVGRRSEQY